MTKRRRHRRGNVNATQKATRNKDAAGSEADGDRLTKLPNDLLLNILERVDTLDAIRACVLSKRMMKLPTMLSHFFLSISSIPGQYDRARVFYLSDFLRINSAVAHVTDTILSTRSPEIAISKLKIRFILTQPDCSTIAKSVARSMATHKVGAAEFEIIPEKFSKCSPADLLIHAKQFNDFFGACPDAFAGLTCLWLNNMRFVELDIHNILSTCKLLESLRLTHCDSGFNSVLQLEHAQLTELEVEFGKFEVVELTCLPKLQLIWVLLESPKLLRPVLSKLQHVNLEHLPEGCDLAWTMFILEAAPSLKEMCITVWDHWCVMARDEEFRTRNGYCEKADMEWKPHAPDFKHKNLVKLTIYGFQPDDIFVRFIRCVMEHAVNMAEISLHDKKVCLRCGDLDPKMKCPSRYPRNADERMQIIEELGMSLPVRFLS